MSKMKRDSYNVFVKKKAADRVSAGLVGSEMCIRERGENGVVL